MPLRAPRRHAIVSNVSAPRSPSVGASSGADVAREPDAVDPPGPVPHHGHSQPSLSLRWRADEISRLVSRSTLRDGDELVVVGSDSLVVSPMVDLELSRDSRPFRYGATPYVLPSQHATWKELAVDHFRRSKKVIFDGPCVRLESEPRLPGALAFRTVGYFDTLATDFIAQYDIVSTSTSSVLHQGSSLVFDCHGRLRDLEGSWAGNSVGVSTVAISSDGALVLIDQGGGNVSSPGLVAPSGSGSASPDDFVEAPDSQTALTRGMERELREECNLTERSTGLQMATRLTGFARWLDHGGKPEFYGVTWMDIDAEQLRSTGVSNSERPLVDVVRTTDINLRALRDAAGDLQVIARGMPERSSVPLLMCVRALSLLLVREPDAIESLRRVALSMA